MTEKHVIKAYQEVNIITMQVECIQETPISHYKWLNEVLGCLYIVYWEKIQNLYFLQIMLKIEISVLDTEKNVPHTAKTH